MDEIISGVQVIKMYAWEKPFTKLIRWARKLELKVVQKSSYVRGLYMTFNLFTTRAALFCTLLTMALSEQEITAAKVFFLHVNVAICWLLAMGTRNNEDSQISSFWQMLLISFSSFLFITIYSTCQW